jgi:hypothetical protein
MYASGARQRQLLLWIFSEMPTVQLSFESPLLFKARCSTLPPVGL